MFKDKTFEEIVAIMNTLTPQKLKHFYDLAQKIDTDDDKLYSKSNIEININANTPKNPIGLYVLYNLTIVFNTLNPSEYVFNFDSLPSGRSL